MRGTSHIGLVLGLLVLVFGCSRKVTTNTTSELTDSTYVKEVPRFVEVKVPGDTVTLIQYIECDSVTNKPKPFNAKVKGLRSQVAVKVNSDGQLTTDCVCDSLRNVVKVMDKEIFRLRHEKKEVIKVITHTEYKTRWYDIAARWVSVMTIIGFFIYLKFK